MALCETALWPLPGECEAWLSDGSDLVAEEMGLGQGWNCPSTTLGTLGSCSNFSITYILYYPRDL